MNPLLGMARIYIPAFVKKRKIEELFNCTASAFECSIPDVSGLSFDECLKKYALFTQEEAEKSIRQGKDLQAIKNRLYQNAFRFGEKIRKQFHVATIEEAMALSRILYHALGIEFHGTAEGEITINRCFFSGYDHRFSACTGAIRKSDLSSDVLGMWSCGSAALPGSRIFRSAGDRHRLFSR